MWYTAQQTPIQEGLDFEHKDLQYMLTSYISTHILAFAVMPY